MTGIRGKNKKGHTHFYWEISRAFKSLELLKENRRPDRNQAGQRG